MDIWIRSVRTWAHLDRRRAASWSAPVFSSGSDAGTITVPGETNDYTGDWLICDGRLYTIKSCSPKNGVTQISVQLPEQAFARQLRYSGSGAERFGTFLASILQTEYIDQTDDMYSMPYLSVSSLDTTAFAFPVAGGEVYTLLQIIRLAAASGVYLTWTPSISGLAVQIASRESTVHHLFFSSGHEQLITQTYTSSVVAKATVRQTQTDRTTGEVTVLDSATYYWHTDGTFSTTPPDPRIPGTWVLTDVNEKKTLEEGAAAAFGRNTQAYKIEFYSDREMQLNDLVLCRIGELVVQGYVTFARRSSADSRIFYRAGDAATTLTEKVGALGSRGSATVVYGGGGGGGGGATPVATISLPLSWTDSGSGYYTCTPTIAGISVVASSKIDLQPTQAQTRQLQADGVSALYVENNNGVLTAYAVGNAPTTAMTIQCTVEDTTATSGVLGDTVGVDKKEIIVDHTFWLSFSAGTPGTRGAQGSIASPYPLSRLKSVSIVYTDSSNEYIPVAFAAGGSTGEFIYCNHYRAMSSASPSRATTVRMVFSV